KLGVLYYLIYNPEYWQRDRHQPFEMYKLIDGQYQLQIGEPFWMPEVDLGIGRYRRVFDAVEHEFLYWYDAQQERYLATDEQAEIAKQEAQSAKQEAQSAKQEAQSAKHRTQLLEEKLRELGVDPDLLGG
ncbi:MAG: hypothetical protein F6K35_50770, partial [Okeania sp. SIO2H7]|nr:hypothetical protein [Okeania sp. SIO2H7]